jgi:hypothetical protein
MVTWPLDIEDTPALIDLSVALLTRHSPLDKGQRHTLHGIDLNEVFPVVA